MLNPGRASAILALLLSAAICFAADELRFKVAGMDCEACAKPVERALKKLGAKDIRVDWKAGEVRAALPDGFEKRKLKEAIAELGFEAVLPGEDDAALKALPADVARSLDIRSFSDGKAIDYAALPVTGKITIVDYHADWCSPCKLLEIRLQRLLQTDSSLALRRIDVGKWDNDAARQATRLFRLDSIPYVRVYDEKGAFVGEATGGKWTATLRLIEEAKTRSKGSAAR